VVFAMLLMRRGLVIPGVRPEGRQRGQDF